jgi:hypothetical protein
MKRSFMKWGLAFTIGALLFTPAVAEREQELSFGLDGVVFDNNDNRLDLALEWRLPLGRLFSLGPVLNWSQVKVDHDKASVFGLGAVGRFILGGEGTHFYFSAEAVKLFEDQEGYFVAPGFGGVLGGDNFFVDLGIDRPFRGDTGDSLASDDSWRTRARLGIRF